MKSDTKDFSKADDVQKRFLGVKDIQKIFGIGRNKAVALMNRKDFPAIRIGRTYRVDSERLEEWIESEIRGQSNDT